MSIIKNTPGQFLYAVLVSALDGTAITTGASLSLAKDGAASGAAGAALTHRTGGLWEAALAQADTNGSAIGYVWGGTNVIPQGGCIITVDYPRGAIPSAAANANGGLPILSSSGSTLAYTLSRVTLVDTTTANTDMRGTNGAITSLTGIATATNVSNAQAALATLIAAVQADTDDIQTRLPTSLVGGRMDANVGAIAAGAIVTGSFAAGTTLPRVTLVDTVTANTDMRGTDGAITNLTGIATAANVSNAQSALATLIAAVQADTDDIQTRLPASLVSGRMNASVGAIAAGVIVTGSFAAGTTLPRVTLVDTVTANTDMRGTDGAITSLTGIATGANVSAAQAALAALFPADYQQRGVAVMLPNPAPAGYGGSFEGEISGLSATQAAQLAAVASKVIYITPGRVTVVSPSSLDGKVIEIVAGDDYRQSDGRALSFTSDAWPVLTGGTVRFKLSVSGGGGPVLTVNGVITPPRSVYVELPGASTANLLGGMRHELEATLANGHVVTLLRGQTTVEAQV